MSKNMPSKNTGFYIAFIVGIAFALFIFFWDFELSYKYSGIVDVVKGITFSFLVLIYIIFIPFAYIAVSTRNIIIQILVTLFWPIFIPVAVIKKIKNKLSKFNLEP